MILKIFNMARKLKENKLHISNDKDIIIVVNDSKGSFSFGYNMRNENFIKVKTNTLSVIGPEKIFKYVNLNDYKLLSLICQYYVSIGHTVKELSTHIGLSSRTLQRYFKMFNDEN